MDLVRQVGETRIGVRFVRRQQLKNGTAMAGRMWLLLDDAPVPMDTTTAAALGSYFNLACSAVESGLQPGINLPVTPQEEDEDEPTL